MEISKDKILLRDIAVVMTSDYFKQSMSGSIIPRSVRRIECPAKLDAAKRSQCEVTKGISVKNNSVIIVPQRDIDALFIPFLLDSLYIKGVVLGWKANVTKLSNLPVIALADSSKGYFSKLESMLLTINMLGEQRIGYEYFYAAERLLADLRDAISFELYTPELLHAENIVIADNWIDEVKKLEENNVERGYEELVALINSLLKPNNALYDNLKRYYLLIDRIKNK